MNSFSFSIPSAAALRADASDDFRSQVELLSGSIDYERADYRRARCERFGHRLGPPQIQYKKHTCNRGRWFIVVHSSFQ